MLIKQLCDKTENKIKGPKKIHILMLTFSIAFPSK